jgi:hypothetical protein
VLPGTGGERKAVNCVFLAMNSRLGPMNGGGVRTLVVLLLPAGLWAGVPPAGASAQAPGPVTGVVQTTAKALPPLRVTFDQKVCGSELPDESLSVDARGRLANVVVTLVGVKATAPPRKARVVNQGCAFVPRVQVVGTGATLETASADAVLHTTTLQNAEGRQLFNLAMPIPGLTLSRPIAGGGVLRVGCAMHQWMRGWVIVSDEVAVVTGRDGAFRFPDVPAGRYTVRVWHETLRAPDQSVTIGPGTPTPLTFQLQ